MTKEELGMLYPITLEPFNPEWKSLFEKEKHLLSSILGSIALRIEHIGSTAIPGIMAKPTIDILVEIPFEQDSKNKMIQIMVQNDYIHMVEQIDHLVFGKGYSPTGIEKESYHIHLGPKDQDSLWNRIYFRDYLTSNFGIAKEYERLKIELASKHKNDREMYTNSKTEFILKTTEIAKNALQNK